MSISRLDPVILVIVLTLGTVAAVAIGYDRVAGVLALAAVGTGVWMLLLRNRRPPADDPAGIVETALKLDARVAALYENPSSAPRETLENLFSEPPEPDPPSGTRDLRKRPR